MVVGVFKSHVAGFAAFVPEQTFEFSPSSECLGCQGELVHCPEALCVVVGVDRTDVQ